MMENKKYFIVLITLLCACLTLFFLKFIRVFSDTNSNKVYKQGMEFYNKGDYQNAYYNFRKISIFSSYSGVALYRQATCAAKLNDTKTAYKRYSKFAKIYKNTALAPSAIWQMALIRFESGNIKGANKLFRKLKEKYPESDFAKAACYYLAVINKKDVTKAKKYLIEYIEYAPSGKYSKEILNLLQNYNPSLLTSNDKLYMAISFYENGLYKNSLSILKELPFDISWTYLAKNYDKLSDYPSFSKAILKGVSLKQNPKKFSENEILDLMALYIKKTNLLKKQAALNLMDSTKNNAYYPLGLFLYSKYLPEKTAIKNYEKIYNNYPESIVAPDSLWINFWHLYNNRNYAEALKLSRLYTNLYFDYNIQPKIMFWSAKIHLKLGHKKMAKSILHNIVLNFPTSYYAFRASSILNGIKNPFETEHNITINKDFLYEFPLEQSLKEYKLLNKFAQLKDYDAIQSFKIDDPFLNSWLFAMQGKNSYSMLIARDEIAKNNLKISFKNPKFKLSYPLLYKNVINNYSSYHNLNPYLMMALMREESFFNPYAVSSTDARGLMQLMPSTAKMLDRNFTDKNRLFNPEYNISIGTKYFAMLMKEFNNNEALSILAYNSGPNAVKKWLKNVSTGDFDEFVENIPYIETSNYIKKVYSSYWCYRKIYENK